MFTFSENESFGRPYVAYVAENMNGNLQYAEFLDKYDQGSLAEIYFTELEFCTKFLSIKEPPKNVKF